MRTRPAPRAALLPILLVLAGAAGTARADEGMWTF
jgi:hypothetical protein